MNAITQDLARSRHVSFISEQRSHTDLSLCQSTVRATSKWASKANEMVLARHAMSTLQFVMLPTSRQPLCNIRPHIDSACKTLP